MSARVEVTPLPTSRSFIPGLDGIRALCVITIFLFHAQITRFIPGGLATTTFFFLSGFLITTLFVKEWRKTGTINLGGFYLRRSLRTLPPLFVAMLIALGASMLLHVGGDLTPWKVASNFFSYTNYALAFSGDNTGFLPGAILLWSLAVDEHYYIAFAPFFKAVANRFTMRRIVGMLFFLCMAFMAWRIWLLYAHGAVTYRHTMSSDTRIDSILWGSLLALWRNPFLDPDKAKGLIKPIWLIAGAAGILFVGLSRNWWIIASVGYTIFGVSLIPFFALAVMRGGNGPLKFLHWPWLLWVSRASYPLYLLQWIMIMICEKYVPGPRIGQIAVAAVLTVVSGAAMHYWLEVPLAALRKRSKKLAPPPLSVPSLAQPAEA